tara:strand:- start:442 stop:678 length:237 start_codon:yes stop_codon:yes gene_type:complete
MKTKILKTKVNIELTPSEYHNMVSRLNQLDSILSTLNEMNDLYLSDVGKLYNIKWDLREILDAQWNSEKYKYVVRRKQ